MKRLEPPPAFVARPRPPPEPMWRSALALVLIVAGVGLIVSALRPLLAGETSRMPADITLVTEPAELKERQRVVSGLYVTGQQSGDRELTVSPEGYIVFGERGPRQSIGRATDTYRVGQRGERTCLVTTRSGILEAVGANTLVYYGDTYRRVK
jgi:hypothetical protein